VAEPRHIFEVEDAAEPDGATRGRQPVVRNAPTPD
jgi:hypothetical protein